MNVKHPIRVVARQTGISAFLIRAWERRYGAVLPERSDSGQRLYSEADINRLKYLKAAVDSGESISQMAKLSTDDLAGILRGGNSMPEVQSDSAKPVGASADERIRGYLDDAMNAVRNFDIDRFEAILMTASSEFGRPVFLEKLIEPLMLKIGDAWKNGELKISHEHAATAIIRTFLGTLSRSYRPIESAPTIVIATPSGQLHEFGAMISSIIASSEGWNAVYLGPDSPADDIANIARKKNARAVALSIVYPSDDPRIISELRLLRKLLGDSVAIAIGGRAAENYRAVFEEIGAYHIGNLAELRDQLRRIRSQH